MSILLVITCLHYSNWDFVSIEMFTEMIVSVVDVKSAVLNKGWCTHLEIREFPDHATFREKGVNTGLVRQTWGVSLFGPM